MQFLIVLSMLLCAAIFNGCANDGSSEKRQNIEASAQNAYGEHDGKGEVYTLLKSKVAHAPEVRNALLSDQQSAYDYAWNAQLGALVSAETVLYGGMGPDVVTALQLTNASHIVGVDYKGLSPDRLSDALDAYDILISAPPPVGLR